MKSKSFMAILLLFTMVTIISMMLAVNYLKLPLVTDEFLSKIGTIQEQELKDNLDFYKQNITQEINTTSHRSALQNGYFVLGYIESLQENYDKSDQYYYRALSIKTQDDIILKRIYQELAFNAINKENIDQGVEYFKLAEQIAKACKNDEELTNLYFRSAIALDQIEGYDSEIIRLLESVKNENQSPYQKIESLRLLAKIYIFSGHYNISTNYLLEAFQIAVRNGYESIQREITIELGNAYYLNKEYLLAVHTLYPCLWTWEDGDLITYFESLTKSLRMVYGYEYAIEFLNQHVENIGNHTQGDKILSQFWVELLRAELDLLEGFSEDAILHLEQASLLYDRYQTDNSLFISYWIEKIYLDYLVTQGETSELILNRYTELYQNIANSDLYFIGQIGLLEGIVSQTLALEDYYLGYDALTTRLETIKGKTSTIKTLNLQQIYDETKQQLNVETLTQHVLLVTMVTIILFSVGSVFCLVVVNRKKMKQLKLEASSRKNLDSLTDTLTKFALYKNLERYYQTNQELTFIVVQYDELQRYNEVYGYLNGDKIVKVLAEQVKVIFDQEDISRHSGHFFIIVSTEEKEVCIHKVKELIDCIYELNITDNLNLTSGRMTISAGISQGVIESRIDIDHIIRLAEHNLDVSRQRGKNTFTI